MKSLFLTIFILGLSLSLSFAQSNTQYSRVKVILNEKTVGDLALAGFDITHGSYAKNRYYINDFSSDDIKLLDKLGFFYEIQIADVKQHYLTQTAIPQADNDNCNNATNLNYQTPANFNLGTMGGYFKYQEILDHLDSMAAKYPNLITSRTAISTTNLTHEGRPIYWLRISDNPTIDETEPEAIYTALHHAREPGSVSQMIFYMWYLLENYATDPEIQYLIDNTELYFIPIVNPDGYIYNEVNDPNGGGLWRKNRRLNSDGSHGVDLNRNYGYKWGFDNSGSSPNTTSSTYRGTAPFSEPETQNVRDFCAVHNFKIALNYHTYGNLLIYPWGYSDQATPDSTAFRNISQLMIGENNYLTGTGTETVGYIVNGDTDDFMYGDTITKGKIISMTPEVGSDIYGFWPPATEIIFHGKENLLQNLSVPRLLLNFGKVTDQSDDLLASIAGSIGYEVQRLGFMSGNLTVSLQPISQNIIAVDPPKTYTLNHFETQLDNINYTLSNNIQNGEEVVFALTIDNGTIIQEDTLRKIYGQLIPTFQDTANTLTNWNNTGFSNWVVATDKYYSAPSSFTESPNSNYSPNATAIVRTSTLIDLTTVNKSANLRFWTKWAIEPRYDYTQVSIVPAGGGASTALCGLYTVDGSIYQDQGKPVFDGVQSTWVQEDMDLTPFIGQQFYLEFAFYSDGFIEDEGFYFDDIEVWTFDSVSTNTQQLSIDDFITIQAQPNPASNYTTIVFDNPLTDNAFLTLYNSIGQQVLSTQLASTQKQVRVNTSNFTNGIYFYQLDMNGVTTTAKKLLIIR